MHGLISNSAENVSTQNLLHLKLTMMKTPISLLKQFPMLLSLTKIKYDCAAIGEFQDTASTNVDGFISGYVNNSETDRNSF